MEITESYIFHEDEFLIVKSETVKYASVIAETSSSFSEHFWYILIGIIVVLTLVVIFVIVFLYRHSAKKSNNYETNRPLYSQGQTSQNSEDLFELSRPQPPLG